MPSWVWILIALLVVIVVAAVVFGARSRDSKQTERLNLDPPMNCLGG